mgnify:FL=1
MLKGKGKKDILLAMNAGSIQVRKSDLLEDWSFDSADFVNRLIQRKPENRLGHQGFAQIKAHPWLKNFPWDKILDGKYNFPFQPMKVINFGINNNVQRKRRKNQDLIFLSCHFLTS